MSFLAPSQRPYDALNHPDLPQLSPLHPAHSSRMNMHSLPSYDNLSVHPLPPLSSLPPPPAHVSDRSALDLPRGQTRCYWSLLTSDLTFLYLDPVLSNNLQDQARLLIGKSLLSFVHPDEQGSAKDDLGSVLQSRTLHGSVTRVRYSRLSRVRRQLGYQGPLQEWPDAEKISVDESYMAVDIVINWASDGLVLCFMHAAADLTEWDNDEHDKTAWTNWCGTPSMSSEEAQLLYQQLLSHVPQPPTMSRVFQILLNQEDRALYMSWPPDQRQGGPSSKDFARLAQDVKINNAISGGTDAKTNCTRRYKALQVMPCGIEGNKEVESIFILYGALIFACHKVNGAARGPQSGSVQSNFSSQSYSPHVAHTYYDASHSYSLPPVPAPPSYNNYYPSQPRAPPSQYSGSWSPPEPSNGQQYGQWAPPGNGMPPATTASGMRSSSYSAPPQQHQWSSQPPSYMDSNSVPPPQSFSQPIPSSMPYSADSGSSHDGPSPSPASDHVPPSRITQRRGSGNSREQYGSGGRSSGNPPVGISKCSSCKVTQSPEWRKGPSGKKDLCNACGLRFARSRAKKEGGGVSSQGRRRKDRAFSAMVDKPSASPSTSPVDVPFGVRRSSLYEDSFTASSQGSASGSDMYPPHHGGFSGMTPSPSPPSGGMGYVQYSHHHSGSAQSAADHRSHMGAHSTFYSVPPPPLPNGAVHPIGAHSAAPVPRIEPLMSFPGRFSPMLSPSSPGSGSPLGAGFSAASFEREKHDKDHERVLLPPTPVSADARHVDKQGFMIR